MINSLCLTNFQSHKKTELQFHENVNVIVGESNKGKSAIIRALNLLVNNKPNGDSYRSNWGGDTQVDVDLVEGQISRIKTNKENAYVLGMHDSFKAFGQGVPQDIQDILNMSKINIQYQLDTPFLLSETPGEIARYFNRIVDLEIIDVSLKNADSRLRKVKSEKEHQKNEIQTLEHELQEYTWIEDAEKDFILLEKQEKVLNQSVEEYNKYIDLIESYEQLEENEVKIDFDLAEKELKFLEKTQQKIKEVTETRNNVSKLVLNLDITMSFIKEKKNSVKEMQKKYKKLMGDACPLCGTKRG